MKKWTALFSLLLLAALGAGVWVYQQVNALAHSPIHATPEQLLTIKKGTTGKKLGEYLHAQGVIDASPFFPLLLKLQPELAAVKAGTYSLQGIRDLSELLRLFASGKEAQFAWRVGEGDTAKQVLASLTQAQHLTQDEGQDETALYRLLALPEGSPAKLEGWLYPDTYHYTANSSALALLKRASDKMQTALSRAWAARETNLPLKTPYELLILASIVEKETALDDERAQVAAVFINRLRKNMRLQTDPTVIYGMGARYQGNIRRADLNEVTAYNTYQIDGLPPTPIAMPSEASLHAVAHPAQTSALYFVANGQGGHTFSATLGDHNRAVAHYLQQLRKQKHDKATR
ncbi:endolytic transglycosylase MltG [Pasteurellaceae bacterium HPA106]|uniref:endolytic transglycosylase MltG n=1 Tax=Spirabiliibacterium pneumoniae TaxID=221400 RepID=UPI001AADD8C7|nr:endolytic transglycosylase MltG [Spirabiliibacterium pneumoniae]MBE2896084.1 endolytic transglycosylase MltG [Spirabiliibacterium pneumoniae]